MIDRHSSRKFIWSIVIAQGLVQIGAFSLPALLPGYIEHWHLTKTEAALLVGIFFAAYVVAVPVLVALTDRVPARKIYVVGAGLTAFSHLGFAVAADGFWWGLILRAVAGIGWAGAYMPGLKAIADTLEGDAQSRAVSAHAAGVGVAGQFLCHRWFDRQRVRNWGSVPVRRDLCPHCYCNRFGNYAEQASSASECRKLARVARLPARVTQSRRDGLDCWLYI
jgi:hypothetical protein